jgi:hypothetical protein
VLCRPILATVISKSLGLEDRHRSVGKLNHPTHVWSNPGRVDNRSRDPRMSNDQNIFSVHQKTTSVFFHLKVLTLQTHNGVFQISVHPSGLDIPWRSIFGHRVAAIHGTVCAFLVCALHRLVSCDVGLGGLEQEVTDMISNSPVPGPISNGAPGNEGRGS